MKPRIYTYRVTFEEIPDWYWGVHKETKYGETYLGSPKTHAWKWDFYTPHLQICEIFPYTDEGWGRAREIEDRCILPDLNNPLCLNEHTGGYMSLEACKKAGAASFTSKKNRMTEEEISSYYSSMSQKAHEERDQDGKSELGKINGKRLNEVIHSSRDDNGKSKHALNCNKIIHSQKDDKGRSLVAMKTSSQRWLCLETGHISAPGPLTRYQLARGIDPERRVQLL